MTEYDDLFSDEFFLIDVRNLNNVETKFYGYAFNSNSELVFNENIDNFDYLTPNGAYILVENTKKHILISQDFQGSYGLYIYQNNSNCCISNSFLKLFEYIKNKYSFSINYDYAKNSFAGYYSNFIYKETLINEINVVSRYYSLKINKKNRTVDFIKRKYSEKNVEIDSPKAISILDYWYKKWVSILKSLKNETNNIVLDLTAGYDSRLVFGLALSSGIDLNQIVVYSTNNKYYTHEVDYGFAKKISKKYGFKINNMRNLDRDITYFKDLKTSLLLSLYTRFGSINQIVHQSHINNNAIYHMTGYYGENLRDYHVIITEKDIIKSVSAVSKDFKDDAVKLYQKNMEYLKKDYEYIDSDSVPYGICKEAVLTNHFGKLTIDKYLINEISLNPLGDYELYKIKRCDENCEDNNLLMVLIFTRFCPELLEYKFNDKEVINQETIDYARKINEKYPLNIKKEKIACDKRFETNFITHNNPLKISKINRYLRKLFLSYPMKKSIEKYFKPEVYDFMKNNIKDSDLFSLHCLYPGLYFAYVMNAYEKNHSEDIISWLNYYTTLPQYNEIPYSIIKKLLIYVTARMDFIVTGRKNDVEIISCDDEDLMIKKITWLKSSKSNGKIVESTKSKMKLKIKCKEEGKLEIYLRGKYVSDKNNKKDQIYIDYTKFVVNKKVIFDKSKLISHDNYYMHTMSVKKDQIISINIDWKPFDFNKKYN